MQRISVPVTAAAWRESLLLILILSSPVHRLHIVPRPIVRANQDSSVRLMGHTRSSSRRSPQEGEGLIINLGRLGIGTNGKTTISWVKRSRPGRGHPPTPGPAASSPPHPPPRESRPLAAGRQIDPPWRDGR